MTAGRLPSPPRVLQCSFHSSTGRPALKEPIIAGEQTQRRSLRASPSTLACQTGVQVDESLTRPVCQVRVVTWSCSLDFPPPTCTVHGAPHSSSQKHLCSATLLQPPPSRLYPPSTSSLSISPPLREPSHFCRHCFLRSSGIWIAISIVVFILLVPPDLVTSSCSPAGSRELFLSLLTAPRALGHRRTFIHNERWTINCTRR